jgi:hypothetical protein
VTQTANGIGFGFAGRFDRWCEESTNREDVAPRSSASSHRSFQFFAGEPAIGCWDDAVTIDIIVAGISDAVSITIGLICVLMARTVVADIVDTVTSVHVVSQHWTAKP